MINHRRIILDLVGILSTTTVTVTTTKIFFNGHITTPGERCAASDIKNNELNNFLGNPKYMRLPISIIPQEIINEYNLAFLVDTNVWVCMKIIKGMYGLK